MGCAVFLGSAIPCVPSGAGDDASRRILARVAQAEAQRDSLLAEVESSRRYELRNPHWKSIGTMEVRMRSNQAGKRYEITRMQAQGMQERVFRKLLEAEVTTAQKQSEGEITPERYDAVMLPDEICNDAPCHVFKLLPKEKTKFVFEGKVWIDPVQNAVVRIEGRTAKRISFWIGRPYVIQEFRKVGDHWLAWRHRSISDVLFLGKTELSIEYLDYVIRPKTEARTHLEPGRTPEADSVLTPSAAASR